MVAWCHGQFGDTGAGTRCAGSSNHKSDFWLLGLPFVLWLVAETGSGTRCAGGSSSCCSMHVVKGAAWNAASNVEPGLRGGSCRLCVLWLAARFVLLIYCSTLCPLDLLQHILLLCEAITFTSQLWLTSLRWHDHLCSAVLQLSCGGKRSRAKSLR
jgi:hypothetical protein